MNDRHAGGVALVVATAVVIVVATGGGTGPVLLAGVGTLVLAGGLVLGAPALVVVCAICQVGAVGWLVGSSGEWVGTTLVAPGVWVAAEAGWRSLDLRPAVRARSAATVGWVGLSAAIGVGSAAFAVLVTALSRTAPAGGLTFRALGMMTVVLTAGLVTLAARRRVLR